MTALGFTNYILQIFFIRLTKHQETRIKSFKLRSFSLSGYVKIGRSTHPVVRINHIQQSFFSELQILAVFKGDYEKELHYRYHAFALGNEWFRLSEQQIEDIKLKYKQYEANK
jgi:hypothetical protein